MMLIKDQLEKIGVRPSKQRGQNFLHQRAYCEQLLKSVKIKSEDFIVEIGPGLGALTKLIFEQTENLTCIEIEDLFVAFLKNEISSQISFIQSDFRKVDLEVISQKCANVPKIISNLPYVFSTDAILWLIKHRAHYQIASLLVQKEFAERIAAAPHSKAYGSISVHAQYYLDITLGVDVPGTAFHPTTKVPSQQLILTPRINQYSLECPQDYFETVVRSAFSMRRKTLVNCITSKMDFNRGDVESILQDLNINKNVRAENVDIQGFCDLSGKLFNFKQ